MSSETLTTLLQEAQKKIRQNQFAEALRIIREAKIIDLHNVYLSALEQCISATRERSASDASFDPHQLCTIFAERALVDLERRTAKRNEQFIAPDEQTLEQEKIKNLYFQRTDELLERNDYSRALEEIRRIYVFDSANIVAREYEQKIEQLIELKNKDE